MAVVTVVMAVQHRPASTLANDHGITSDLLVCSHAAQSAVHTTDWSQLTPTQSTHADRAIVACTHGGSLIDPLLYIAHTIL